MLKRISLAAMVLVGVVAMGLGCSDTSDLDNKPALKHGMTVEQVEKIMGQPLVVLPNFGAELRHYDFKGKKYMITFENGEVVDVAW